MPLARRYRPQLLLISAGYDAHIADPLAGMAVSVAGFAEMARIVRGLANELCEGRVAAVLEGGYNIEALSQSVVATIGMLVALEAGVETKNEMRSEQPPAYTDRRTPDVGPVIRRVKQIHDI